MILMFFEALDAALEDPKMRALVVSVCRKLWDAMTDDPNYDANLMVQEKTLSAPDSTLEEKQDALKSINSDHPKT